MSEHNGLSLRPYFKQLDTLVDTLEKEDYKRSTILEFLDKAMAVCFTKSLETKKYVWVNAKFKETLGISDVIGKTDFDLFPHTIAENLRKTDDWVSASGSAVELIESVPVHGEMKNWLVSKFVLQNGEALIGGMAVLLPDKLVVL